MFQNDEKLSQLQKQILEHLHKQPERWEPRAIRTRLDWRATDRAVLSRALASLEQRGLVVRKRRNGRTVTVTLTPAGQEIAAEIAGLPERIKELQREGERRMAEMHAEFDRVVTESANKPLTPAVQAKLLRLVWAVALGRPKIYTDPKD